LNVKLLLVGFALIAALSFVSAVPECWQEHDMPNGAWLYQAWLCVNGSNHGWIYTVAPPGIPQQLKMFKVELQSFTYIPPYAATLNCYEQFTDVDRQQPGQSSPNSVPPKPSYSWHFKQTVTLNAGEFTPQGSEWTNAECPPIKNYGQQGGNPPQVLIYLAWNGEIPGARMTATPFAPFTAFNPTASALDGAVSANDGAVAWLNKFAKRKAFKR